MKKFIVKITLILSIICSAAFGQKAKLIISVSGEVEIDVADVLMDGISYGLKNNDKYQVLINDRQFKETLKKEWQKGNIKDDRIIALAKNAGADYLCFTKIKSVKGLKGKQVTAQIYDLNTMSYTSEMGMKTIKSDFSDLEDLTNVILNVVEDMLGTVKGSSGGGGNSNSGNSKTFKDPRDGKQYKIVKMHDNKIWMAENLNYNANGSKCYDNKESNCQKYGRLYNWAVAETACPSGWHLPGDEELDDLMQLLGGWEIASKKLKAAKGWEYGNGTDDYGFSALPSGYFWDGRFVHIGEIGYWWCRAYKKTCVFYIEDAGGSGLYYDIKDLSSVRCIKD
jgi:uncharacterized protein (TIGR02145 family)